MLPWSNPRSNNVTERYFTLFGSGFAGLGINPNTLHTWINKYSQPKEQNKTLRTDEHLYDELKRLKKEIARLTEERDLLKKAAAYFAREQR
jgi:transposase